MFYESLKSWLANSVSSHCTVISCSLLTFVLQFQDRNLNLKQSNAIRCHRISQSVNNICLCSSTTERCLSQLDDFTTNTDQFTSLAGGSLPGLCDFRKDVLRLLNKRLVQDSKPGGQQGGPVGPGGFLADGLLVIQAEEWKVMFHNLLSLTYFHDSDY